MKCMLKGCNNQALEGLVYGEWAWCSAHYEIWRFGIDLRKNSVKPTEKSAEKK